jgi:uncharacterized protein (TIGR02145 family)
MKRIIFTIVFVLWTSTLLAQYKMSIKNADNTTQDIWIHDITEITFTNVAFTCGTSTITYAGQTYNTMQIGSQCWLKENLNIGTRIDGSSSQGDNSTIEKYCYNDNASSECDTYGGLYQWNEAMQYITTAGAQGICPTGWHIPTQAEFQTLKSEVGSDGNKLLAVGQGGGTNTSGFSALLAGDLVLDTTYVNLGTIAFFWSSKEAASGYGYYMDLKNSTSLITITNTNINYGFSVRCLKD